MSYKPTTSVTASATGTVISGPCVVKNFHLAGGADASTAIFRDGASGPIRAKLSAVATGNDDMKGCFRFVTSCHVTLTGTAPVVTVAIDNPQANQLNPS